MCRVLKIDFISLLESAGYLSTDYQESSNEVDDINNKEKQENVIGATIKSIIVAFLYVIIVMIIIYALCIDKFKKRIFVEFIRIYPTNA